LVVQVDGALPRASAIAGQTGVRGGAAMFGCSEHEEHRRIDDALTEHLATPARLDRLSRTDTLDGDAVAHAWESRRISRRAALLSTGAMALAAAAPSALARPAAASDIAGDAAGDRVTIESIPGQTVHLGQFRMDVPDIATVDSGDVIRFPNTLTHFLGALQPGLTIQQIAQLRLDNPGRGPHSIIGPIGVRDAHPGDMLEVRFRRLDPIDFGVNFHNPLLPGLRSGTLPDEFPNGQVIYFNLDRERNRTQFRPGVHIPLAPFQGTFGLAPPGTDLAVSSVPPGQHGGNIDLREIVAGSRLFIPVWRDGARIYTGDSHVAQGDGEVNLTAIESAMRDLEIQVVLHQGALAAVAEADRWPMAETGTHWIAVANAPPVPDQQTAFRNAFIRALHNVIAFLNTRAGLTRDDAYALSSIAVSFRITQVVDTNIGVHAMIPKSLFDEDLRRSIRVA
jgi:acetamidase/formamidase